MRKIIFGLFLLAVAAGLAQAQPATQATAQTTKPVARPEPSKAVALVTSENGRIHGLVVFVKAPEGVRVEAVVTGLPPGRHGIHIHEYGDCSSPDYTSAGSHFMTSEQMHGAPDSTSSHLGDMGNLVADDKGYAHLVMVDSHLTLTGADSILGRAVVIHEKEDDLTSQPAGNSGGRIACGTIGVAKP